MQQHDNGGMIAGTVRLRWDNLAARATPDAGLDFIFESENPETPYHSLRSQLWISMLASGIAWGQPWLAAQWTVGDIPSGDASGNGVALAIALIATASRTPYPQDTVVLSHLNPDGSLSPVSRIEERIQAAAKAGIKCIIIPASQRYDITANGVTISIPALAKTLGMRCVLVEDLVDATMVVLQRRLPRSPSVTVSQTVSTDFQDILFADAQALLKELEVPSQSWPREDADLDALPVAEQDLWRELWQTRDLGVEAYHAGKMYSARKLLRQTHAAWKGVVEVRALGEVFDHSAIDERANRVRQKMMSALKRPDRDKNELQSALIIAEETDWITQLNASVQGAQLIFRQATSPRSSATPEEILIARSLLVNAVAGAEYQMSGNTFYQQAHQLLITRAPVPVFNRAAIFWPQLMPAQLVRAEMFILALKSHSNASEVDLLFDVQLSSFMRQLRDAKFLWEEQQAAKRRESEPEPVAPDTVGFVPGAGYSPPRPPVPPVPLDILSDAARCLNWVNEYCQIAIFELQYIRFNGGFDSRSRQWQVHDRIALESMLQVAAQSARDGIALAESVGADSSMLKLIFEYASTLRASTDNNFRLEALHQYWRGALLGAMCWQLSYTPKAIALTPHPSPAAAPALSAAPAASPCPGEAPPARPSLPLTTPKIKVTVL